MSRYRGTQAEENYIKALFKILEDGETSVSTNALAHEMNTSAASASDMLKKLSEKGLVDYAKYQGAKLTKKGDSIAKQLIRKHRLWEVFLVDKLKFKWDEVHDLAEELEHINSEELTERLEEFLEFPKYDPHGDPIPDKNGNIDRHKEQTLADLSINETGIIVGVKDHSKSYLNYLDNVGLVLGAEVQILGVVEFDNSMSISINKQGKTIISNQASKNLYIKKPN